MIILIFWTSRGRSVLVYRPGHRVAGLTLPPSDANHFFHQIPSLAKALEKKLTILSCSTKSCVCR